MIKFNIIGDFFSKWGDLIFAGIATTLILSFVGTFIGLILGVPLAYGKMIKIRVYDSKVIRILKIITKGFCNIYSTVLRGTPMMVQALIFKFGCQAIGINWGNIPFPSEVINVFNGWFFAGLIVITLNTAAYMGEVIIAGINGVDVGQLEGAKSLGISPKRASFSIILPQAIRNSLPTIGNELIINIKDSSVLNVIAVTELYYRLISIASTTYAFLEAYLLLAVIYLVMTLFTSFLLKLVEKKLDGKKISLNPFGRLFRGRVHV
ncbi:MAG: amino acid ABC transporter permease [Bacilli bacterium]|nr:amino acid ABC transporter permease [Bacilli bacterium]